MLKTLILSSFNVQEKRITAMKFELHGQRLLRWFLYRAPKSRWRYRPTDRRKLCLRLNY